MNDVTTNYDLDRYVRDVRSVVDARLDASATVARVSALNEKLYQSDFRMPDELRRMAPEAPYTRNLVHQDPQGRFSIIALVWGPFQETAVHDHLSWCVMGVLEETCLALDYTRNDDGSDPSYADLSLASAQLAPPGTVVGLTPPPNSNIHRISNAGRKPALTLHTYGDPGTRARIFDPASGRVEIRELVFHNI